MMIARADPGFSPTPTRHSHSPAYLTRPGGALASFSVARSLNAMCRCQKTLILERLVRVHTLSCSSTGNALWSGSTSQRLERWTYSWTASETILMSSIPARNTSRSPRSSPGTVWSICCSSLRKRLRTALSHAVTMRLVQEPGGSAQEVSRLSLHM